jgi:sulfonate transport system permease protein
MQAVTSESMVAPPKKVSRKSSLNIQGLYLPITLAVLVELAAYFGLVSKTLLPPPSEIARTLFDLALGPLWKHIGFSTMRVFTGFMIGAGLGTVAALIVGLSRNAEKLLDPSFQGVRAIPSLAWVPLLLLWLGIDETSKIAMIAIGAFFPVYLSVLAGIRNVDRKLIEVGEMYGFSQARLAQRIFLPAAMPNLFTGLRTGLSVAWMFLVAAELLAATKGVGYLLTDGRETSRPDIVLAAIIVLALLGKFSDGILKSLETRALVWRDSMESRFQ